MTISNTKLTKNTKATLNMALAEFAKNVYSYDFLYDASRGITVLMVIPFKGSNICRIATSIMSPDEKKFRKSVGRYYAYSKYTAGRFVDTPVDVALDVFNDVL